LRTVWACEGLESGVQTVEGRLTLIRHDGWGPFEAFVEIRLTDARPFRR
jgi:hypothetical protein